MNVLTFASRKGGSGKSTLAAHLAAQVHKPSRPCLLIDDDPQGSLALWNELRGSDALPLKTVKRGIADTLRKATRVGIQWVFIDTPPNMSVSVIEAIHFATLVIIPCRPSIFDIDAVQETIGYARKARTPYAVVINGAPPRRQDAEIAFGYPHPRKPGQAGSSSVGRPDHPAGGVTRLRSRQAKAPGNSMPTLIRRPRLRGCGSPSKSRSRRSVVPATVRLCIALPHRPTSTFVEAVTTRADAE